MVLRNLSCTPETMTTIVAVQINFSSFDTSHQKIVVFACPFSFCGSHLSSSGLVSAFPMCIC